MPEYEVRAEIGAEVDEFTRGYLECAEWCGIDDEDEESFADAVHPRWTEEAVKRAVVECAMFQEENRPDIDDAGMRLARMGHDFWLTRNRHGAGFWDGDYPEKIGESLTQAAHAYGEVSVVWDAESETLSFL